MSGKDELVFCPLGGVGEIGMNFALYGFGPASHRQWMIVDCGVTFPDLTLPGVDLVLPDTRFIESQLDRLVGMVITHAHEDHYGALLDIWPKLKVPVWMTPFAAGLLQAKREGEAGAPKIPVTIYKAGETFDVGPFRIEAIPVTHSIPEPVSLAITTPLGTVIHTGDWKLDPRPEIGPLTDEARFKALGDAGVIAMMCDSTNALRTGESPPEQAVGEGLRSVIMAAEGRVAVTTFSSNVGRIRSIAEAARDCGARYWSWVARCSASSMWPVSLATSRTCRRSWPKSTMAISRARTSSCSARGARASHGRRSQNWRATSSSTLR